MRGIPELAAAMVVAVLALAAPAASAAQDQNFHRGLMLEGEERFRDAAEAYRQALRASPASLPSVLGLERVYATLGWTDSMLPVLDRAIAAAPRVSALRAAQLRSFRAIGRHDRAREAFDRWVREVPRDPAPYREYARMLIQDGEIISADSVLRRAQSTLGRVDELEIELAQLRAAMGLWQLAAASWRRAVAAVPHFEQAAVFSLAPTPPEHRDSVRTRLVEPPREVPPLRVAAGLEVIWGSPEDGWRLLANLPPDSASIAAWRGFAERAEEAQAWLPARDAMVAAWRASSANDLLLRAALAALTGGDAASAADLSRRALASGDEAVMTEALPTMLRALGTLGRPQEAQRVFAQYESRVDPEMREELTRQLAWSWVRAGNTARARELLGGTDLPAEVEGWLALYDGDLESARRALSRGGDASPQLLTALSVLTRTRAETAPLTGSAFLALARGDTSRAASMFEAAARELPDASSLLLMTAANLRTGSDARRAVSLWRRIAEEHAGSAEAPEALLEWARALRRGGDYAGAAERLEHLILAYPRSALLPQARRELQLARVSLRQTSN